MTELQVFSDVCSKTEDGRKRHYFRSVDGAFVCQNCGEPSDPTARWESRRRAH